MKKFTSGSSKLPARRCCASSAAGGKDKKRIKELEKEIEDLNNKWKRALADYQNLEKKVEEQKKQWVCFATEEIILKILPVLENLEKATLCSENQGLSLTVNQLKKILEEEGLVQIPVRPGSKFDANIMECVDVAKGEEGKVLKVLEKGYKLKDKVLKVARVVVGKSKVDKKEEEKAKEQLQKGNYM